MQCLQYRRLLLGLLVGILIGTVHTRNAPRYWRWRLARKLQLIAARNEMKGYPFITLAVDGLLAQCRKHGSALGLAGLHTSEISSWGGCGNNLWTGE